MRILLEVLVIQVVIAILGAMMIGTYHAMEQVSMMLHQLEASSYIRAASQIVTFVICIGLGVGALYLMRAFVDRDYSIRSWG
jgi:putative Mn2+ efflux pump MntP